MSSPSALAPIIAAEIAARGPMPVERYMELCLAHPEHGYYMNRDPFGRAGDFITAPEVSQMFGELIGVWCAAGWPMLGTPDAFHLVELGPGRGTLMKDALKASDVMPGFGEAAAVSLVETSPALTAMQRQTLADCGHDIAWRTHLDEVPSGPCLIIANEFFDALPVRQLVRGQSGWRERAVTVGAEGAFAWGEGARVSDDEVPAFAAGADIGAIVEVSPARSRYAAAIARRLAADKGAAVIIDYGHPRSAPGDTLQAVRRHERVDALTDPGLCDLTSHVDFQALAEIFTAAGLKVHGPLAQALFLIGIGLRQREEMLRKRASARQRIQLSRATQRLVAGNEMGQLFKVMVVTHADVATPAPFNELERQQP